MMVYEYSYASLQVRDGRECDYADDIANLLYDDDAGVRSAVRCALGRLGECGAREMWDRLR